ncbi:hypothetical protein V8D89_001381 [Ganoderma adspersum]
MIVKVALLFLAFTALVGTARAQLSPCLSSCLTTAQGQAGCGQLDISCMCTSSAFQADVLACVNAKCTPADLAAAKKFGAEFCPNSSGSS